MSAAPHGHDHDHDHQVVPFDPAWRVKALESLLTEKGLVDPTRICLKAGFNLPLLYELVYTPKDPIVIGAGLAAMRDVMSFFRFAGKDDAGTLNPLTGMVPHVLCMGNSQSGRLAKEFLHLGFNEDESGRMARDGMNPRIAGALGSFNIRLGRPGAIAELYDPDADGPGVVGRLRGRRPWASGMGFVTSLRGDAHLS
jgi:hypothetical protein